MKKIVLGLLLLWASCTQVVAQLAPGNGLHYTPEEVAVWRDRFERGPFLLLGDAGTNTPAEVARLKKSALEFLKTPTIGRWRPYPTEKGCVPISAANIPQNKGDQMRDAAFWYLVSGVDSMAAKVRGEILAQIDVRATVGENPATPLLLDFTNASRWCNRVLGDNPPTYYIAAFLSRILFSYDYTKGYSGYTTADRAKIEAWLVAGATFLQAEVDYDLNRIFVDRANGNYNFSGYGAAYANNGTEYVYYGGPLIPRLAYYYNNRRGQVVTLSALVGVMYNKPILKASVKKYYEEFFRFSCFPNGVIGEMERGNEGAPEQGWQYAWDVVGQLCQIADVNGRIGDTTYFTYTTNLGLYAMAGGPKGLKQVMAGMSAFQDGTLKAYCTNNPANVGKKNAAGEEIYLINGYDPINNREYVNDTWMSIANRYYRFPLFTQRYNRERPGMRPFPVKYAGSGSSNGFTGPFGLVPSFAVQFLKTENSTANSYIPAAPTRYNLNDFFLTSSVVSSTYLGYSGPKAARGDSLRLGGRWVSQRTNTTDSLIFNYSVPVRVDSIIDVTGVPSVSESGIVTRFSPDRNIVWYYYSGGTWTEAFHRYNNLLGKIEVAVNIPSCTKLMRKSLKPGGYYSWTRELAYIRGAAVTP